MSDLKQPTRKNVSELKNTVWISGKLAKVTPAADEDSPQTWKVYSGLAISYLISVPADVYRNRAVSVEDELRVFAMPGRTKFHPYTAVDFEVRKSS